MAKLLKIITTPNPILDKKSNVFDVKKINSQKTKELIADMKKTMLEKDGVGLAAPQIGINTRIIVINTKDGPIAIINPLFTKKSWAKEWGEEGCLSVPNTFGEVKRHKKIKYIYHNEKGEKKIAEAEGLMARILQHETDHLDGVLFISKAKNITHL